MALSSHWSALKGIGPPHSQIFEPSNAVTCQRSKLDGEPESLSFNLCFSNAFRHGRRMTLSSFRSRCEPDPLIPSLEASNAVRDGSRMARSAYRPPRIRTGIPALTFRLLFCIPFRALTHQQTTSSQGQMNEPIQSVSQKFRARMRLRVV